MKHEMLPLQDDFPFPVKGVTAFVCRRETVSVDTLSGMIIRKFKSNCGNILEVHITRRKGFIRSITPVYTCQPNCPSCADRIEKIHQLIADEHAKLLTTPA